MLNKSKTDKFINELMKYLGDSYSQPKRLQKGYSDCSSLIQKAGATMGWWSRNQTVSTIRIRNGDARFRQIPISEAQRGDILWYQRPGTTDANYFGHVAILINDTQVIEAILPKVAITSRNRIKYQRAYRIKALEETEIKVENKQLKGKTTANLNVRSLNSTKGSILKTLKKGTVIDIVGVAENGWYKLKEGGFVSPVYVSVDKPKAKVIENIDILINGKNVKKGYIVNGITYITINGKDLPVRQLFENMGAKVEWKNDRVEIKL